MKLVGMILTILIYLNIKAKEISYELERLLDEFKLYTIYQDGADWDEFHGFTIVAKSEKEAREMA